LQLQLENILEWLFKFVEMPFNSFVANENIINKKNKKPFEKVRDMLCVCQSRDINLAQNAFGTWRSGVTFQLKC